MSFNLKRLLLIRLIYDMSMFRRSLPAQLEGGKRSNAKKMKKNSTAQVLDQQLLVHRLSKPVYD